MKDHYNFSKNLKEILNTLGITQVEFAEKVGITPAAVSQLCSGIRDPSLHTIVRILKVIPVKFERLVDFK